MRVESFLKQNEMILYHGSRGGIDGKIEPKSRVRCDFGAGFYMGTNPRQAKGLVVEDTSPIFCEMKIDLAGLKSSDVLVLDGMDWVYAVLANRGKVAEFNALSIAAEYKRKCAEVDFVVGSIADDRMNEAMRRFSDNGLTDKGLLACLDSIDYGFQVVAKTKAACERIEILSEKKIDGEEADNIRDYVVEKRKESRGVVDEVARKYIREGLYLTEIIEKYTRIEAG